MHFFTRKRIFWLLLPVALLVVVLSLPLVFNYYVNQTFNLRAIKADLVETVKWQTGLKLDIQSVKFRFLKGIIFTGIKVSNPERPSRYILESENLVLELSIYDIIGKELPVYKLVLSEGKLNPWALKRKEWIKLFDKLGYLKPIDPETGKEIVSPAPIPEPPKDSEEKKGKKDKKKLPEIPESLQTVRKPPGGRSLNRVEFEARNLRITFPENIVRKNTSQNLKIQPFLDINIQPGPGLFNLVFYTERNKEKSPRWELKGQWKVDDIRRLNFEFNEIPAKFLLSMLEESPFLIPEVKSVLSSLKTKSGIVQGRGSMDLVENGLGLNAEGQYRDLAITVQDIEGKKLSKYLTLHNSTGKFQYNTAYQQIKNGPAHGRFSLNQPNLDLTLNYKNIRSKRKSRRKKGKKENHIELQANLNFQDGPLSPKDKNRIYLHLPGVQLRGALHLFSRYSYKKRWISPNIKIQAENLDLILDNNIFSAPGLPPQDRKKIHIAQGELSQTKGEDLKFNISGKFLDAPFTLIGQGENEFRFIPRRHSPYFILDQDVKLKLKVSNLSYKTLVEPFLRLPGAMMTYGTSKNAPRMEDYGAIYQYRFISEKLDEALFRRTKYRLEIQLADMADAGGVLPEELNLVLTKSDNWIIVKMPAVSGPSSELELDYEIFLRKEVPWHIMEVKVNVKDNKLAFPELFRSNHAPRNFYLNYKFDGGGWLIHDLLTRTNSYMSIELEGADMSAFAPSIILKHKLKLPREAFLVDKLKFQRVTEGSKILYNKIEFDSKALSGYGRGLYQVGQGGYLKLKYSSTAPDSEKKKSGTLNVKISKDNKMTPDRDF